MLKLKHALIIIAFITPYAGPRKDFKCWRFGWFLLLTHTEKNRHVNRTQRQEKILRWLMGNLWLLPIGVVWSVEPLDGCSLSSSGDNISSKFTGSSSEVGKHSWTNASMSLIRRSCSVTNNRICNLGLDSQLTTTRDVCFKTGTIHLLSRTCS